MKATPTHERPKVINLTDFNQKHRFQICLLQSAYLWHSHDLNQIETFFLILLIFIYESFYYLCLSCNRTMLSLSEKNFSDVEPWSGISRNTTVFFTY